MTRLLLGCSGYDLQTQHRVASEVTGSGPVRVPMKAGADCLPAAPLSGSSCPALAIQPTAGHSAAEILVQLMDMVAGAEASCPLSVPVSPARQPLLYYCRAGGETRHKSLCGNMGMWARNRLRGGGWPGLPTTSSRTSFQRMRLPVSCTKVTLILLWMP